MWAGSRGGFFGLSDPNRIVKVTLEVDDKFLTQIPVDSQAGIAAENLLGTKYINIRKGRATDIGEAPAPSSRAWIRANSTTWCSRATRRWPRWTES